jgi:hypothetical protein
MAAYDGEIKIYIYIYKTTAQEYFLCEAVIAASKSFRSFTVTLTNIFVAVVEAHVSLSRRQHKIIG